MHDNDRELERAAKRDRLRKAILASCDLVDDNGALKLLGAPGDGSVNAIKQRVKDGQLLCLISDGAAAYPLFQIDLERQFPPTLQG